MAVTGREDAVQAEQPHVVTIRDVADAAKVSITTVSHVFNRPDRVAEETRRRVSEVAAELAYRPNVHARQLVTRKSCSLAIQVAGHFVRNEHALVPNSEYFLEILNGASRAADDRGYALILTPPDIDPYALDSFAVDGVLLVDPAGNEPILAQPNRLQRIVTAGRPQSASEVLSVVDNDHHAAAIAVMEHLHANGYERPAVLVSDKSRSYVVDLIAGYRKWVRRHQRRSIVIDLDRHASTTSALDTLLERGADAVYTSSENIALDVLQEARRRGIDVPTTLGLCSAVDSGILQLTSPQISGMFLHPREIGRRATNLLIDLVEGVAEPGSAVEIPVRLMERDSTRRS
ncbi:MAG: hypothetical protein QOK45_3015 [Mycobacterium sp.]|jgi:DNA-binding LacI/PurR family transcriptional regulator|nr:hypothetical protein [Mycobacterium sp.]